MTLKGGKAARQQNAANARAKAGNTGQDDMLKQEFEDLKDSYDKALHTIQCLEGQLAQEKEQAAAAEIALKDEQQRVTQLRDDLEMEKRRYQEAYRKLHVERCARQRGHNKKRSLEGQIHSLKSTALNNFKNEKRMISTAGNVVKSAMKLEKENVRLKSDLTLCLKQAESCNLKLVTQRKELRNCKREVCRLKACYKRAAGQKECAIKKIKEKILKEKSVHNLMSKGVYTEDTRNLICVMARAGCAKEQIGQVISAVLKCAGITTIGSVSRRTVSRVVMEGLIASQIQLGYEMQEAESQFL